jgi:3',5'-nucleoside bisphosphate phosphatase
MLIDLQLHSTFSDGYLSPKELVDFAKKRKIKTISLTDHNTISGLKEAREEAVKNKIKVIPGIELYVKHKNSRLNFLWYNFDENNESFLRMIETTRKLRLTLVKKSLQGLRDEGYKIDEDFLFQDLNDYIPINRITERILANNFNYKMVSKKIREKRGEKRLSLPPREGEVMSVLFFNKDKKRLSESYISSDRILKLKKDVGGQIIFGHPGKYGKFGRNVTRKLKDAGIIDGIEVLSPHHSIGAIMYAQFLADKLDLIATGGSDFHRFEENNFPIQNSWDWFSIDSRHLRRIKEIIS